MSLISRAAAFLATALLCVVAFASTTPFDKATFDKAVAAGEPVIVQFHADWCPTCKAQKPIVHGLMNEAKMKEVTLFVANYDTEKDLKKKLNVAQQSTFVVFKGGKEAGRSTGQTKKDDLAALFDKAL